MNTQPQSFRDLLVWQKSADLGILVYRVTARFPSSERYGITSQMRRAAVSISSNIAEGFKRPHKKEKLQFYVVAHGSSAELESQTEIAHRLNFLSDEEYERLLASVIEVSKMLTGLSKSLNPQPSILNSGFTVVELLVAIGIFSVIVSIAMGGFTQALRSQRQAAAFIAANSNMSLALEQMTREIRGGLNFTTDPTAAGCSFGLAFDRYRGNTVSRVSYCLDGTTIVRDEDGAVSQPVVADNVLVKRLDFLLLGDPNFPPRITIVAGVAPDEATLPQNIMYIQTTVSAR